MAKKANLDGTNVYEGVVGERLLKDYPPNTVFKESDGSVYLKKQDGTTAVDWVTLVTSGAGLVADQSIGAGARNPSSTKESYLVTREECNLTIVDVQTAITIGGGVANDTHLMGVMINVALTGTCVIAGFEGSAGTAISITIPAATPAGFIDFKAAINSKGPLTVTCSNASDDNNVQILWKAA
ncbi:MAG TPA: hypothetical protein ENK38_02110 [Gammaproteobacteria bacterium]|nr:hypothetical protein [Gammaproteobacteria bacterium]